MGPLKQEYDGLRGELDNFAYLDLGRATVVNGAFRLELDIPSPPDKPYSLRLIRFDPWTTAGPAEGLSAEEQRNIEEALRATGYLW